MSTDQILIGSIGTSDYAEITYELNGKTVTTKTSPVALSHLLDIDTALIFRTTEAGNENDDQLAAGLEAAGVEYEFIDIELITEKSNIDDVLGTVVCALEATQFDETSVVLDISHSFRTLPMVFLLSLMQFEALEPDVRIERVYYSRFAGSDDHETAPVIDFTHLRTLIEWYNSFQTSKRTGALRGINSLLNEKRVELFTDEDSNHPERDVFQEFVDSFNGAQKEIDAGFPLEAGIKTKSAIESLSNLDPDSFVGPEGIVLEPLEILLKGFEIKQDASSKDEIQLNKAELRREAEMVEYYMNHEKYWIALEVGQELFINRLLYDSGETENWLDYEVRSNVDLDDRQDDDQTSSVNEDVERIWNQICVARNSYAHAGFKKDNPPSESTIKTALGELCNRIDDDEFWRS